MPLNRNFPTKTIDPQWRYLLAGLTAAVFVLELVTPLGFAHGTLYAPLLMAAVLFGEKRFSLLLFLAAAVLTAAGYGISPPAPAGFPIRYVLLNRTFSLVILAIIWGLSTAVLSYIDRHRKFSYQLEETQESLRERERYYRGLLYSMHEDILVIDESYRITDVKNSCVRTAGLKREEIIGRKCYEVFHGYSLPCDQAGDHCSLKEVFETGRPQHCLHTHYNHESNQQMFVDILLSPITDESGKVIYAAEAMRDISDIIRGKEELHKSQELLRMAGSIAKFGGWYLDKESKTVEWSEETAAIHEVPAGFQPTPEGPLSFYAPEYRHEIQKAVQQCLLEGTAFSREVELVAFTGRRIWVYVAAEPARDGEGNIIGVHGAFQDISRIKEMERSLQETQIQFQSLVEGSPIAIFVHADYSFVYLNQAACSLFGSQPPGRMLGTSILNRIHPSDLDIAKKRISQIYTQRRSMPMMEQVYLKADGSEVPVEVSAVPITFDGSRGALVYAHDISERKEHETQQQRLQNQLAQAQKMESVGRLAGGIAHDYNNMMGVIIGYAELAMDQAKEADLLTEELSEILQAARRASAITQQLLAFARKQTISPEPLDVNSRISGLQSMLRQLIGEDIRLEWRPKEEVPSVFLDGTQLDQILMNLAANARDAVDSGGCITIETDAVSFDDEYCSSRYGFLPGEYTKISVSDDGTGIDPKVLDTIFEPFYTTKSEQKGSGLGMSMVYGIVRQNGGFINIYSEPGEGTTVNTYFPCYYGPQQSPKPVNVQKTADGTGTHVLVVEDDESILQLTAALLERLGYHVTTAGLPGEAVELVKEHPVSIDLLVTDVVMPGMTGRELSRELQRFQKDLRTLYMSGYTANVITHRGVLDEGVHFIQKPFSLTELSEKLKEVLS